MQNERRIIKKVLDDFLKKLGLTAKYTLSFTKFEQWKLKVRDFSGSLGQRLLLVAHLAIKTSDAKTHTVVMYWS